VIDLNLIVFLCLQELLAVPDIINSVPCCISAMLRCLL